MIASSSAFWWCSGFSFHDETAVANVGSLYHRATTYSLELYLPVRTVAANDDSIVSSHLALMMLPTLGSRHICRNHHLGSWHLCQRGSRHICRNHPLPITHRPLLPPLSANRHLVSRRCAELALTSLLLAGAAAHRRRRRLVAAALMLAVPFDPDLQDRRALGRVLRCRHFRTRVSSSRRSNREALRGQHPQATSSSAPLPCRRPCRPRRLVWLNDPRALRSARCRSPVPTVRSGRLRISRTR